MDFYTVSNCYSVKVDTVSENVGNKNTCDIPVATKKNITKIVEGKHKNLLFPELNILDRGHVKNQKLRNATVANRTVTPRSEYNQTRDCQKTVTTNPEINTTLAKNDLGDKYALDLHNSNKSNKIQEAKAAPGNETCIHQNRPLFGFIPIYGLKSRVYDSNRNTTCTDIIKLHKELRLDNRPTYMGLQIPVFSKLNHDKWARYLNEYWDWQLPLLIKYGFPLDFDRNSIVYNDRINHKSALQFPDHVTTYLQDEIANNAILGPFKDPPIDNLHISPFMTRDKSSSVNRRVIIYFS